MRSRYFVLGILLFLFNTKCFADTSVETVPYVDLNKYIGKWYEIASIPQYFQRDCVANTTAEYTILEDGLVKVINSCDTQSGERKQAEGRAKNEDLNTNSKLKVTFVKFFDWIFLFGGNYWIIDLDSEYRFAVVGDPSRKYSWILSRTPELSSETLNLIKENLKKQGYDTCLLLTSIQENGNFKERKRLCDL